MPLHNSKYSTQCDCTLYTTSVTSGDQQLNHGCGLRQCVYTVYTTVFNCHQHHYCPRNTHLHICVSSEGEGCLSSPLPALAPSYRCVVWGCVETVRQLCHLCNKSHITLYSVNIICYKTSLVNIICYKKHNYVTNNFQSSFQRYISSVIKVNFHFLNKLSLYSIMFLYYSVL